MLVVLIHIGSPRKMNTAQKLAMTARRVQRAGGVSGGGCLRVVSACTTLVTGGASLPETAADASDMAARVAEDQEDSLRAVEGLCGLVWVWTVACRASSGPREGSVDGPEDKRADPPMGPSLPSPQNERLREAAANDAPQPDYSESGEIHTDWLRWQITPRSPEFGDPRGTTSFFVFWLS